MGRVVAALAFAAVACTPDGYPGGASGSLFLMNQTHETHRLARFRANQLDCSRDTTTVLERTTFEFDGCTALAPADVVALDRERFPKLPVACDAVAFQGTGLAPQALFWNDTSYSYSDDPSKADAVIVLFAVGSSLVFDPAPGAALVPLAALPESPCAWAL